MKYDNTLLYEKNVEKDQKLFQHVEELNALRQQIEIMKAKEAGMEKEIKKAQKACQELRDLLAREEDKIRHKERVIQDLEIERENQKKQFDD